MTKAFTQFLDLPDELLLNFAQQAVAQSYNDKEIFKTLLSMAYTNKRVHDVLFNDVELWKTALLKMLRSLNDYICSQEKMNSLEFGEELAVQMKDYTVTDVINAYFNVCHHRFLSQRRFLQTNISHCNLERVKELLSEGADPRAGEFEYTGKYQDINIPLKHAKSQTRDYANARSSYYATLDIYYGPRDYNDPYSFRFNDYERYERASRASEFQERRMRKEEGLVSVKNEIYQTVKKPLSSYPLNIICHRSLSSLSDYFAVRTQENVKYLHPRYAALFRKDSTKENKLRVARACKIILTCSPGKLLDAKSIYEILVLDKETLNIKQIESIIGNGRLKKVIERYNMAVEVQLGLKNAPKM